MGGGLRRVARATCAWLPPQALSHSTLFPTPPPIIFTKTATYLLQYNTVPLCEHVWHAIEKYATNNIPLHWQHCSVLVGRGSKNSMLVFLPPPPLFPFPLVVCTALTLLPTKCTNTFVLAEYYRVYTNLQLCGS